jgi:uncharacterized protein YbaP (TraB family)
VTASASRCDRTGRLLLAAMAALLPVLLAGYAEPVQAAEARALAPFSRGLLWRVSKPGLAPSHVFGTIHIPDPRVLLIPDPVRRALAQSKSYAMEIEFHPAMEARFFEAAQFEDGRRLEPMIGAEAYAQLQAALRPRELPEAVIARMKPWAALANLTVTPEDYDPFTLDQKLYALARTRRLPAFGLEGIEEQIAVFEGIPPDSQVALLRHGLAEREHFVGLIEPTIQAWLKRDLALLDAVHERTIVRYPQMAEHYRTLTRHLIDNRSVVMAHRLFLPLRKGGVFVAIGADHLYGEKGVLRLLQKQGYRITRVY